MSTEEQFLIRWLTDQQHVRNVPIEEQHQPNVPTAQQHQPDSPEQFANTSAILEQPPDKPKLDTVAVREQTLGKPRHPPPPFNTNQPI